MIFDNLNPLKFLMYKTREGPFFVIFYQENNDENRNLYIYLYSLLKNFPDLPFLRFNYDDIKIMLPEEKTPSKNEILVLEKGKENRIIETRDYSEIWYILQNMRENFREKKRAQNMRYKRSSYLNYWAPYRTSLKIIDFIKFEQEDAAFMYQFPNNTAKIFNIAIKNSLSKVILSNPEKSKRKGVQNLKTTTDISFIISQTEIGQKQNLTEPNSHSNISKFLPKFATSTNNDNQPLNLSIRRPRKVKDIINPNLNPPNN